MEWFADFPVVSEGVADAANAPAVVLVFDGPDDGGSGGDGSVEEGVGVVDGYDEADGASLQRCRAGVLVVGGFVGEPERCAGYFHLGDGGAGFGGNQEENAGSEGGLVEGDGFGSVGDVEEGFEGGHGRIPSQSRSWNEV